MEEQSRRRKIFSDFFVIKPIGFVIFLLLGITVFVIVGSGVNIPVYMTVQTTVEREGDHVRLKLGEEKLLPDTPVFIYQSRDDYLEKIVEYEVDDGYVVMDVRKDLPDKQKVNMDVQTKEISLLKYIFMNGGNAQ